MTQQCDFFVSEETGPVTRSAAAKSKREPSEARSEDEMIRRLQATGRYRVLTTIEPRPVAVTRDLSFSQGV